MNPNANRPVREWMMWRLYFLGCTAHVAGYRALAAMLWRVKDWFARGRTQVSVMALLAGAYDEDSDE